MLPVPAVQRAAVVVGTGAAEELADTPINADGGAMAPVSLTGSGASDRTANGTSAAALDTAGTGVPPAGSLATDAAAGDAGPREGGADSASAVQAVATNAKGAANGAANDDAEGRRHPLQQRVCGSPAVDGCAPPTSLPVRPSVVWPCTIRLYRICKPPDVLMQTPG